MTDPTPTPNGVGNGMHTPQSLIAHIGDWETTQRLHARANTGNQPRGDAPAGSEHFAQLLAEWKTRNLNRAALRDLPKPQPLIGGNILYTASTAWLTGAPGTYKSFIALDWALCVATGTDWLGRHANQGRVLYIAGEGLSGLDRRIEAWQHERRITDQQIGDNIAFRAQTDLGGARGTQQQQLLLAALTETPHALLVIDTQARATPGVSENDKDKMDAFINHITEIAVTANCAVLTIHHDTKNGGRLRGSGSIEGAADTVLSLTRDENTQLEVTMRVMKHKDTESGEEHELQLLVSGASLVVTNGTGGEEVTGTRHRLPDEAAKRLKTYTLAKIVEAGTIPVTKSEIAGIVQREAAALRLDVHRTTVYKWLEQLAGDGLIEAEGGRVGGTGGRAVTATAAGRELVARLNRAAEDDD